MSGAARAHSGFPALTKVYDFALSKVEGPVHDHYARLSDPKRLAALARTGMLSTEAEAAFDRFTRIAARMLGVPTAVVSLIDDKRQYFKSALGLGELGEQGGVPLSHSFCQYAVTSEKPLVVADARQHPWLKDHLSTVELGVVAYAGVPLITSDDSVLGALCVVQPEPRQWTDDEVATLRDLASMTITEIELRTQLASLNALRAERGKERNLLYAILDSIDDAILVTRKDGEVMLANPAARRLRTPELVESGSDLPPARVFEADGTTLSPPESTPSVRALGGEDVRNVELIVRPPGKPELHQSVHATPLRDDHGEVFASVSVGRDVTEARKTQAALARSEAILQGVVRNLPNGAVLLFDHDLRFVMADGEQLLTSIGLHRESLVGRTLYDVSTPDTLVTSETLYRAALAGETKSADLLRGEKVFAVTATPVRDASGDVTAGLALIYDVTAHKQAEALMRREAQAIRDQSVRDELTGLYNRRGFLELARQQLSIAAQMGRPALLFFVDLNGMKLINDQHGHEQGDRALIETGDILRCTFRTSDMLARLGGDEFVALLMDSDRSQQETFEARVQREVEARNAAPDRIFKLSVSIGGATFDASAPESIDALLASADALMYAQKRARNAGR